MSDGWRWSLGDYETGWKSSMDVLVPDPAKTIEPFGFARALHEGAEPLPLPLSERDGWDDHAEALGAAA